MISAEESLRKSKINYVRLFESKYTEWFKIFYELLNKAVANGETNIPDIFIHHRIKDDIKCYLEHHGYAVKEQTLGSTFSISWAATRKK